MQRREKKKKKKKRVVRAEQWPKVVDGCEHEKGGFRKTAPARFWPISTLASTAAVDDLLARKRGFGSGWGRGGKGDGWGFDFLPCVGASVVNRRQARSTDDRHLLYDYARGW